MVDRSDAALLEAWRAGDREAANELLDRHFPFVHRFFWRRFPEDAEDLAQRTFLACLEHAEPPKTTVFRAFLFGVARNQLRLAMRTRRYDRQRRPLQPTNPTSPTGAVARKQEQRLLLDGLRRLPASTQVVIELHYWEGLKMREIAETLDMPQGTVKTRIREGRHQLRSFIEGSQASPAVITSTLDNLERWAMRMRPRPETPDADGQS